ncbi:MAG TPA: alpha/beta hydrolase, partial [Allocoleopsis sp.]
VSKFGVILGGIVSAIATVVPAYGAERISFYYAPFGQFNLPVESLETFAKTGKIDSKFAYYARFAKPSELAGLRDLLRRRFDVTPTTVSQFTYSPVGETVMQRLGNDFQTDTHDNGFHALRAAFILAAADSDGLTVVNILRKFPSHTVWFNLPRVRGIVSSLTDILKQRDSLIAAIQQDARTEAAQTSIDFSQRADLRKAGPFNWQKETLNLNDQSRNRPLLVDLYLPQPKAGDVNPKPVPVIVISHGMASDRQTFAYLAEHLASYGFAVAAIEHPDTDRKKYQDYLSGLASPPSAIAAINRPLDVKFLLDELQRLSQSDSRFQGRLNLDQVGLIGQSLGGYTVLALAGATINFQQLHKDCNPNTSLNLSLLIQCRVDELPPKDYSLKDDRIKAVIAMNPVGSSVFGQSGLQSIKIPVMLVSGSDDIFAPAVPVQIRPFSWLTTSDKYLVLMHKATHFSLLSIEPGGGVLPVPPELHGPNSAIAYSYAKALSVAFFETHIANQPDYRSYLNASYAESISQPPIALQLVRSFSSQNVLLNKK